MLFIILAYLQLGSALGNNAFRLGSPDGVAIEAWPPAPTRGPDAAELRRAIDRRQGGAVTCGWVSGRANQPFTCNAGSACVFNTKYEVFGCCAGDLSTCSMQTSCFGSSYATDYTANGYSRGCTDSVNPHCVTYYLGLYNSYGCGTSQTYFELASTILGEAVTATGLTTGFFPAAVSTSGNVVVGASGAVLTTLPPAASPSAGEGVSAVNGAQPTSGSGGSSTSNMFNNSANASVTGTNLSTGAIVGIAVGAGVIVIALIIISVLVRRRRSRQPTFVPGHGYGGQNYGPSNYGPPPPSYHGSSTVGGGGVMPQKQPSVMTQSNLDSHLQQQQSDEWKFAQGRTPQRQTAARPDEDDGIRGSEIMPDEAVDERRRQEMMRPMSDVGQTAVAPTSISHHVQGV